MDKLFFSHLSTLFIVPYQISTHFNNPRLLNTLTTEQLLDDCATYVNAIFVSNFWTWFSTFTVMHHSWCTKGLQQNWWSLLHPNSKPSEINGPINVVCILLRFVAALAGVGELDAIFINAKDSCIRWIILDELGHPQIHSLILHDKSTAMDVPCSMEMHLESLTQSNGKMSMLGYTSNKKLYDYYTTHFFNHNAKTYPFYVHINNLPTYSDWP